MFFPSFFSFVLKLGKLPQKAFLFIFQGSPVSSFHPFSHTCIQTCGKIRANSSFQLTMKGAIKAEEKRCVTVAGKKERHC